MQAEQMTKQLKRLSPWQMSMIIGAIQVVQQARNFIWERKMLVVSLLVLLLAFLLRWLGYI